MIRLGLDSDHTPHLQGQLKIQFLLSIEERLVFPLLLLLLLDMGEIRHGPSFSRIMSFFGGLIFGRGLFGGGEGRSAQS